MRPTVGLLCRFYLIDSTQDCKNDKSSNINIDLIDNSPFHLRGSFEGPQDTPYQGGHFEVVRFALLTSA